MRSPENQSRPADMAGAHRKAVSHTEIPDAEGAVKGILGVKAPAGYRQTGDIEDRLRAAGVKPFTAK